MLPRGLSFFDDLAAHFAMQLAIAAERRDARSVETPLRGFTAGVDRENRDS